MSADGTIADVLAKTARWCVVEGDCLDVLPTLPDGCAALCVTDPPYAISVAGSSHVGQRGKGSRRLDFFAGDDDWSATTRMVRASIRQVLRVLDARGALYAWVGHRQFGHVVSLCEARGLSTRFLVWAKASPAPPPPGSGWPSGAELCVYAYPRGRRWNHNGSNPPPNNVITSDSFRHGQPGKCEHPTQKPERVIDPSILASSGIGDLVLDPFAGSGTTGVACLRLGRRFIGIEKDPGYAAIARERLRAEVDSSTLQAVRSGQVPMFGAKP